MECIGTIKLYDEYNANGEFEKRWLKVQNAEELLRQNLKEGDRLQIKGLGDLEIMIVESNTAYQRGVPYTSLMVTAFLGHNKKYK